MVEHKLYGITYLEGNIAAFKKLITKYLTREEDKDLNQIKIELENCEKNLAEFCYTQN